MAHTHVQQTVEGVPVWEGEAIVHLKPDGELSRITDDLKENITVNTQPNFKPEEALKFALRTKTGRVRTLTEEPTIDLWIFRGEERDHLAYRVEMPRLDGTELTSIPVVFIDAHTGEKDLRIRQSADRNRQFALQRNRNDQHQLFRLDFLHGRSDPSAWEHSI